jgi:hypothetical protein
MFTTSALVYRDSRAALDVFAISLLTGVAMGVFTMRTMFPGCHYHVHLICAITVCSGGLWWRRRMAICRKTHGYLSPPGPLRNYHNCPLNLSGLVIAMIFWRTIRLRWPGGRHPAFNFPRHLQHRHH